MAGEGASADKNADQSRQKKMSDLKLRLASAIVLGPLVLVIAWWGGAPFALLVTAAGLAFLWEWFSITGSSGISKATVFGYVGVALVCVLQFLGEPLYAALLLALAAGQAWLFGGQATSARWGAEGIVYAGLSALSILMIRQSADGIVMIFFLLIVVWATDICAYFVGRFVGGPKLWSRVSPKKTWSGALGGLFFAVVFSGVLVVALGRGDLFHWALLAAILSAVSQAGDLAESALKRRFEVKDSSHLIPGHGGMMDRIDGLVAAAIFTVILGLAFGGPLNDPIAGLPLG